MKRIRFLLLCVAASVLCGARAEEVPKLPKPTSYVSDLAGVFDAASQQQMENLCGQIDHKAHAQIAVVTVNDLGGESVEQFTTDLQHAWGVGTKDNRGIVMLFAINDHKRRIEVGYGLEGILNDAKVGDIGRSMVPQLKAEEYGPAALSGVQQIAQVIAADAQVTIDAPVQHTYHRESARQSGGHGIGLIGVVVFILVMMFVFSRGGRGGSGPGGGSGLMWFLLGSMMGGGRRGGYGDGGGGGGFSGGGGGDSGGGDGGGFGGFGGGDSGGGGASGDW